MELKSGISTWSPHGLLMCVLVLDVAIITPSASLHICQEVLQCIPQNYKVAIMNDEFRRLCGFLPKMFECFQNGEKVCGDLGYEFNKQFTMLREQYQKRCTQDKRVGRVKRVGERSSRTSDRPVRCSAADLDRCISQTLLRAAQENDTDVLCEEGPGAVMCAERVVASCPEKDRHKKQQFLQSIKQTMTGEYCMNVSSALRHSVSRILVICLTLRGLFCRYQ